MEPCNIELMKKIPKKWLLRKRFDNEIYSFYGLNRVLKLAKWGKG